MAYILDRVNQKLIREASYHLGTEECKVLSRSWNNPFGSCSVGCYREVNI